jgi:hypothetical protein
VLLKSTCHCLVVGGSRRQQHVLLKSTCHVWWSAQWLPAGAIASLAHQMRALGSGPHATHWEGTWRRQQQMLLMNTYEWRVQDSSR